MVAPFHRHEFAVIGLGRFGASLALTLAESGFSVLGIDRDRAIVQQLSDQLTQTAVLDATDEDALREVDVTSFDTVVVAIGGNFESNLLATSALKGLGVRQVLCKAATERQRTILLRLGADRVILPEHEAGARLAQELAAPHVVAQMPLGERHHVTELRAPRSLVGRTLQDAELRRRFGAVVLAVLRAEHLTPMPPSSYELAAGDVLLVVGEGAALRRLAELE